MSTYVIEIIILESGLRAFIIMHAGIQCEELSPFRNGSILYHIGTSFPGTIAMYMCEDGFFLYGNDERNCITEETGSGTVWVWSGQEPRCARKLRRNVLITLASIIIK